MLHAVSCAGLSAVAIGALLLVTTTTCTVFSGWSDLQGGTRANGDADRDGDARDGGARDVEIHDGSAAADAPLAAERDSCVTGCSPALCCRALVTLVTSCAAVCASPDTTVTCIDERDCAGSRCCLQFVTGATAGYVARCSASCTNDTYILCDPIDPGSCPSGDTCQPGTLAPYQCQP